MLHSCICTVTAVLSGDDKKLEAVGATDSITLYITVHVLCLCLLVIIWSRTENL